MPLLGRVSRVCAAVSAEILAYGPYLHTSSSSGTPSYVVGNWEHTCSRHRSPVAIVMTKVPVAVGLITKACHRQRSDPRLRGGGQGPASDTWRIAAPPHLQVALSNIVTYAVLPFHAPLLDLVSTPVGIVVLRCVTECVHVTPLGGHPVGQECANQRSFSSLVVGAVGLSLLLPHTGVSALGSVHDPDLFLLFAISCAFRIVHGLQPGVGTRRFSQHGPVSVSSQAPITCREAVGQMRVH
jgi:hypothetical protein